MVAPLFAVLALLVAACASPVPRHEVERIADTTLDAAEGHLRDGWPAEASYLTESVLRADPDNPRAQALLARIDTPGPVSRDPRLGSNQPRRARTERSSTVRVLLYLPDRLLDLADLVSIDLHLGFGLYANLHATRALQAGVGARGITGIGWHERRSLGIREQQESSFVLAAVGAEASSGVLTGTSGIVSWSETVAGLQAPSHSLYQEARDYWAVGAGLTLIFLGADLDFHPVQAADFVAGVATTDFLGDDFATTRGLRLARYEQELLRDLQEAGD